jgi:hypothetical protein
MGMNLAKLLSMPTQEGQKTIAGTLNDFLSKVAQQNWRIGLQRVAAAYLVAGRRRDMEKGILLEYVLPNKDKIKITSNGKSFILPLKDSDEAALAERAMPGIPQYLLNKPLLLNQTLDSLHGKRYAMENLFGFRVTPYTLRNLRLLALWRDDKLSYEEIYALFLGSWDKHFKQAREEIFKRATISLEGKNGFRLEE